MTESLRIRVLGPIWQPGFTCADQRKIDGAEFERLDIDPHNPEDIRTYCDTHFGDFSAIEAIDAEYRSRKVCSECHTMTSVEHTRRSLLHRRGRDGMVRCHVSLGGVLELDGCAQFPH